MSEEPNNLITEPKKQPEEPPKKNKGGRPKGSKGSYKRGTKQLTPEDICGILQKIIINKKNDNTKEKLEAIKLLAQIRLWREKGVMEVEQEVKVGKDAELFVTFDKKTTDPTDATTPVTPASVQPITETTTTTTVLLLQPNNFVLEI